jgi:hypothetical protein
MMGPFTTELAKNKMKMSINVSFLQLLNASRVQFILSLQLPNDEFPIRVQNANPLSPKCVQFCVACDIRFPNHIHWTFHAVGRPSRHSCIPSHPPIRIKVIDEARP